MGSQCQGRPDIIKIIATSRDALHEIVIPIARGDAISSREFISTDIYIYPNAIQKLPQYIILINCITALLKNLNKSINESKGFLAICN